MWFLHVSLRDAAALKQTYMTMKNNTVKQSVAFIEKSDLSTGVLLLINSTFNLWKIPPLFPESYFIYI